MANLSTTIDTDGVSGDYASFNAALAAEAQDLTDGDGDTWTGTCQATTGVADSTAAQITGWSTGSSNWMKQIAASGHEALKTGIDTDRYQMTANRKLDVYEEYFSCINIQFSGSTGDASIVVANVGASNEIFFDGIYVEGNGSSGSAQGISIGDSDANVIIHNSIFYDITQRAIYLTGGTCTTYNSFYHSNNRTTIQTSGGTTLTMKNCGVRHASGCFSISGTKTIDYNAVEDDDGGDGTNEQIISNWDLVFTDPDNGDLTALSTGDHIDNGIGPSSDSDVPTTDIDGTTRSGSTCDIGADEYVSSSSSVTVEPSTIGVDVSFPAPTVTAEKTVTVEPACIDVDVTFPAPTVTAEKAVTVEPATIDVDVMFPAPTVTAEKAVTVQPACIDVDVTFPAPTVTAEKAVTVEPACIDVDVTFPTPTVTAEKAVTVQPACIDVDVTFPAPTILAGGSVAVQPATIDVDVSFPAPTVTAEKAVTVEPSCIDVDVTFPAPIILAGGSVAVQPACIDVDVSFPAPTVTAEKAVTVQPACIDVDVTFPAPVVRFGCVVQVGVCQAVVSMPAPLVVVPTGELIPFHQKISQGRETTFQSADRGAGKNSKIRKTTMRSKNV